MRIRMKVSVSGSRNGKPWPAAGEVVDVPDREGADLCASALAEPVHEKPETAAVVEDTEKAVVPPPERIDAKAVREWAAENDVEVPTKGRIPDAVVEQFKAAQE